MIELAVKLTNRDTVVSLHITLLCVLYGCSCWKGEVRCNVQCHEPAWYRPNYQYEKLNKDNDSHSYVCVEFRHLRSTHSVLESLSMVATSLHLVHQCEQYTNTLNSRRVDSFPDCKNLLRSTYCTLWVNVLATHTFHAVHTAACNKQ